MADQDRQISVVEVSNPKAPERVSAIYAITRLRRGVRDRVQAPWRAKHTPIRFAVPVDAMDGGAING